MNCFQVPEHVHQGQLSVRSGLPLHVSRGNLPIFLVSNTITNVDCGFLGPLDLEFFKLIEIKIRVRNNDNNKAFVCSQVLFFNINFQILVTS